MSLASAQLGARAGWTARASSNPAVGLAARRSAVLAPGALGLRPPRRSPNLHAPARSTALVVRAEAERKAGPCATRTASSCAPWSPRATTSAAAVGAAEAAVARTRRRRIRRRSRGWPRARVRSGSRRRSRCRRRRSRWRSFEYVNDRGPSAGRGGGRGKKNLVPTPWRVAGTGLAQQVEGPRQTSRQLQRRLRVRPGGASSRWQGGARRSAPR